jgi:hypothetical protein
VEADRSRRGRLPHDHDAAVLEACRTRSALVVSCVGVDLELVAADEELAARWGPGLRESPAVDLPVPRLRLGTPRDEEAAVHERCDIDLRYALGGERGDR